MGNSAAVEVAGGAGVEVVKVAAGGIEVAVGSVGAAVVDVVAVDVVVDVVETQVGVTALSMSVSNCTHSSWWSEYAQPASKRSFAFSASKLHPPSATAQSASAYH